MKRKLMLILGLVLVLSITACTNDDKPSEEVNPPLEDAETPEEDVETDEEEPQVEEPEIEEPEVLPEDLENEDDRWPQDFMPEAPKLNGDIVTSKEEGPKKMFLEFKDVNHEEASAYVASLKAAGFTENTNEQINSNIVKYKGMDSKKNLIVFIWKEEITKLELIKES